MERIALKEWAVAVKAMEDGLQDVIFRKGGIQEPEGDFKLTYNEFLMYPAREHQKSQYLKPEYTDLLAQVRHKQVGQMVSIHSTASVLKYNLISTLEEAEPYNSRHIWNNDFVQMRLDYKPNRPLYVIELKISPLEHPLRFTETTEYTGCRSWVTLHL